MNNINKTDEILQNIIILENEIVANKKLVKSFFKAGSFEEMRKIQLEAAVLLRGLKSLRGRLVDMHTQTDMRQKPFVRIQVPFQIGDIRDDFLRGVPKAECEPGRLHRQLVPKPDQINALLDARLYRRWIVDNGMHPTDDEGAQASEALLAAVDAIDGEEGPT